MENLKTLASQLYEVLGQPVSISILEKLSEKQITFLYFQYDSIQKAQDMELKTGKDLWKEDISNALGIIISILDYGKNKVKAKTYSDKTKFYLKTKFN